MSKRQMDDSENTVLQFLQAQGYSDIVYEPDGNETPDFLLNNTIAVEVRRLNFNTHDNTIQGDRQLYHNLCRLLQRLGPPAKNESLLLEFRCNEQVLPWPDLGRDLQQALLDFDDKAGTTQKILYTSAHAVLSYIGKTTRAQENRFVLQSFVQFPDNEPVLQGLMSENIRYCIEEKSRKTHSKRKKYQQWWLALVDHAGFDPGGMHAEAINRTISAVNDWDKILVIDHNDAGRFLLL